MKKIFIFIFLIFLLFLTACTQCKTSSDCSIQADKEASCSDNKCIYKDKQIIPSQKTELTSEQVLSHGDKFNVIAEFPQPFDVKKDVIHFAISLVSEQKGISDRRILSAVLYDNADNQFIASSDINKYLWTSGKDFELSTDLILKEISQTGSINDPELIISYEYKELGQPKQAEIKFRIKKQVKLQKTSGNYSCPKNCPEKAGHTAYCSEQTDFFCKYYFKSDSCGNGVCESNENKCVCAIDCGSCKSSFKFIDSLCIDNACLAKLKPNINIVPYDLRQDKQGVIDFEVHYKFHNPFSTKKDNLTIEIIPKFSQDIFDLKVDDILIITTGNVQLSSAKDQKKAPQRFRKSNDKLIFSLAIPEQTVSEEDKSLNIEIILTYKRSNNEFSEKITKTLQTPEFSKITLIKAI